METNYKISIPKPCHENWDKMTPEQTGRFCNSCAKSVVDFTGMKASEIQHFFVENQGQKVCGRFKKEQLDSVIIEIPREVLFSQVQFHKMFLLSLLVCMGTTLFSCQNPNGNSQAIDKVKVVDSTEQRMVLGLPLPEKNVKYETDTTDLKTEPKTTQKSKTKVASKVPLITGDIALEPTPKERADPNQVYPSSTVEVKPSFNDGIYEFYEYVGHNFKVSEADEKISGKIFVSFIVDIDGSLQDIKILRGINETLDKEALRVMKASPKWTPGQQNGQKVKVAYALPILIRAKE